jgi:hypothetical protein
MSKTKQKKYENPVKKIANMSPHRDTSAPLALGRLTSGMPDASFCKEASSDYPG